MQQPTTVDPAIREQMQRDWNERAREDAHFYVAFGRKDQDPEEFFATAAEVVKGLEWELRRLGSGVRVRARRALEIGCGPGRLLKPMSRHFGEIHGVDVSDEMIARARANLSGIPHAHPHHTSGADLTPFADESFDFVYSYAVFQHIPSREVVMSYLTEAHRVLKYDGLLRVQINGLDQTARTYDTWSGVRISADEVRQFARHHDMQLLALEGTRTQYMWTSMIKRRPGWSQLQQTAARIRRITNANNSEPVTPRRGRFASVTVWIEHLPEMADLNTLQVRAGGVNGFVSYIGPPEADGLQQVNVILGELPRTGLLPVEVRCHGELIAEPKMLRVIPEGPRVPVVLSVTDGINMMSGTHVVTRSVKVTIEEIDGVEAFRATVSGQPVTDIDAFCADPLPPRWEINFRLPESISSGAHDLQLWLGHRLLALVAITVA